MSLFQLLSDSEFRDVSFADQFIVTNAPEKQLPVQINGRFRNLIYGRFAIPSQPRNSIVCMRSMERNDYRDLFASILSTIKGRELVRVEDYYSRSPDLNPEALDTIMNSIDPLNERLNIACPKRRAAVAVRLAMHEYIAVRTLALNPSALVCFSSMQPAEHLAALVAKKRGIPTVTVQHGLYVEYSSIETINKINYEHQPCDHFLAWGAHTADLIHRYHPDVKTHVCGKPKIFTGSPPQPDGQKASLMVITDQVMFDDANRKLLKIAVNYGAKNNMTVRARFHPSNPKSEYLKLFPSLVEDAYFMDCDLVLGHTTSMIYEAITLGKNTLRFKTKAPAIELPEALTFESENELSRKASAGCEVDVSDHYIAYINDASLSRYRAFFDKFVSELN